MNRMTVLGMSNVPTEDLIVAARRLDPHCSDVVSQPQWDTCRKDPADWRSYVGRDMRGFWGRLDYGERLAVFVASATLAAARKRRG